MDSISPENLFPPEFQRNSIASAIVYKWFSAIGDSHRMSILKIAYAMHQGDGMTEEQLEWMLKFSGLLQCPINAFKCLDEVIKVIKKSESTTIHFPDGSTATATRKNDGILIRGLNPQEIQEFMSATHSIHANPE